MNETTAIFIVLALGFVLMVIVIRFYPFKASAVTDQLPMYYVLNLVERKITKASLLSLKNDMNKLFNEDYEIIGMTSLKEFMKYGTKLPEYSILIAANKYCVYTILKAFPVLTRDKISIVIFIPIFLLTNNKFQEIQTALNQFISAEV
jgi:hypothetical protein